MNTEYELERGQALVITGPQSSGKTTLARKIAEKHTPFIETDASRLELPRGLDDLLAEEPNTVICDGLPKNEDMLTRLKEILSSETAKIEPKNREPKMVKTPNFIFCTGDVAPLLSGENDRRFRVVRL